MTRGEDRPILASMALRRGHIADAAVSMFDVVLVRKIAGPSTGLVQVGKSARREFQAILCGLEQQGERIYTS